MSEVDPYQKLANLIRLHILRMTHQAKSSHIGSGFSAAEILAVLYGGILRHDPSRPRWDDRDRFVISKGHAAAAIYAVLAERGFFPREWLDTFCADGTILAGHVSHDVPGVEVSTGSLGHGLGVATGMALAAKRDRKRWRVFALLSDGECDEGSIWEAALFAPHHGLDNLTVIIDYNKIQSLGHVRDILNLDPLAEKWEAFGWGVREIDGHDPRLLEEMLRQIPFVENHPSCLVAHTVKGKGVSFMEDRLLWHYRSADADEYQKAIAELEGY